MVTLAAFVVTVAGLMIVVLLLVYFWRIWLALAGGVLLTVGLVWGALLFQSYLGRPRAQVPVSAAAAASTAAPPVGLARAPYVLCRDGNRMVKAPPDRLAEPACVPAWRREGEGERAEAGTPLETRYEGRRR